MGGEVLNPPCKTRSALPPPEPRREGWQASPRAVSSLKVLRARMAPSSEVIEPNCTIGLHSVQSKQEVALIEGSKTAIAYSYGLSLGFVDRDDPITEIVATAIVSVTNRGDLDPATIKDRALNAIGARRFNSNAG